MPYPLFYDCGMHRRVFFGRLAGIFAAPVVQNLRFPLLGPEEDFPPDPEWLERWLRAPRLLVLESDDPVIRELLAAARAGHETRIKYYGGSLPGGPRSITPGCVFQVEGFNGVYLSGYCHRKKRERVFRVDLIELR